MTLDPLPTQLDRDDANAKVVIEQDDPNSPLYSASSFEELGLLISNSSWLIYPLTEDLSCSKVFMP